MKFQKQRKMIFFHLSTFNHLIKSNKTYFCSFKDIRTLLFYSKHLVFMTVQEEKKRYSEDELKEFEAIIQQKLDVARNELAYIKDTLSRKNDSGTDVTGAATKLMEDVDTSEREQMSQSAARLQKFITQLENALIRIKNGTYGVCIDTGKLIPKERLRAVPHTQQTIEAKLRRS